MKIRSFLSFDIPHKVKEVLGKVTADFARKETGVRWISAENLHVTMKFFGDVEEELLLGDISAAIENITKDASPAVLDCAGMGVFPDWKYPRIVWAGFIGDTAPVISLQKSVETALEKFPLKRDERAFRLHLTIGRAKELRNKGMLVHLIEELGPIKFGEVVIDHLTLYKSVLTKGGSIYTALRTFGFGKK